MVELGRKDLGLLAQASGAPFTGAGLLRLRRILAPVDFSDCSKKALQYAAAFARQFGANLVLLYAVQVNMGGSEYGPFDLTSLEKELQQQSQRRLAELVDDDLRSQIPIETVVRTGHPVQEILGAARRLGVDLIIMSTHGYTGLKHILLGSITENVVRHAPCPVLVVREHEHEFVAN